MFTLVFQEKIRQACQKLALSLGLARVNPNIFTTLGLLITIIAAFLIALNLLIPAGILVFLGALFDLLDGAAARASSSTTSYGAFWDSSMDRYGEAAIYFGLLYLLLSQKAPSWEIFILFIALVGSLLVSYVKSKAEELGFRCKVGVFGRPERIIITILGLLTGQILIMLLILAVGTHLTVIQRITHIWHQK